MDPSLAIAVAGVLLGAGGVTALIQARAVNQRTVAQAHRADADAQVTLGSGWQRLVETQRTELNEIRERIAVIERQEEECRTELALLKAGASSPAAVERLVVSLIDQEIEKRERLG